MTAVEWRSSTKGFKLQSVSTSAQPKSVLYFASMRLINDIVRDSRAVNGDRDFYVPDARTSKYV